MRASDWSQPERAPHRDISQPSTNSDSLPLWRMFGGLGELVCAVRITTLGYALTLELTGEPILLEVEGTLEDLVAKAGRLERWLLTQGWLALSDD